MREMTLEVTLDDLDWQADYDGNEVGFPDVGVVGFYMQERGDDERYFFLIDMENSVLLKFWAEFEEE